MPEGRGIDGRPAASNSATDMMPFPEACGYSSTNRKWRPFCSARCKTIDLGAWASERYRVPAEDAKPEDPEGNKEG